MDERHVSYSWTAGLQGSSVGQDPHQLVAGFPTPYGVDVGGILDAPWIWPGGVLLLAVAVIGSGIAWRRRSSRRRRGDRRTPGDVATRPARERAVGRLILDSSDRGLVVWDGHGRIVEASRTAGRMFGRSASSLCGMNVRTLLASRHHPEYDERMAAWRSGASLVEGADRLTLHALRSDGSIFVLEVTPFESTHDGNRVIAAMLRESTGREHRVEERRRSDSLRVLMEELPDAVMVHRGRRLLYVNQRFLRALGIQSADAVLGRSIRDLVHPDDWAHVEARLRQLESTGKAVDRAEERFRGPGGTEVTWEVAKVPVVFDGRPAVAALGRDVTGRRLAERRLRQALESAPCGMLMIDPEGCILLANRQVEVMFGFTEAELLGQPIEMLVPERLRGRHPTLRRQYMSRPSARPMGDGRILYGLQADGSEIPVEIGLNPLHLDGTPCVLCSIVDISERVKAEALIQLSDRLATVGTLAAGVAHGINNPLSYVKGNIEYATGEIDRIAPGDSASSIEQSLDEIRVALDQAVEGAERIRDLVADLLTFARHESAADPGAGADLHRVLHSALQMTANELRPRAVVRRHFEPTPWVRGDSSRLAHAFTNLLVNAAHALPEGESDRHVVAVHAWTDAGSGWAIVEIRDTGEGMDEETRRRAFEPFYTTRSVGQGTGLGLSVTHGIVSELGGRIEIDSEPQRGTVVRVALPPGPATGALPTASLPSRRRARILVIDDEVRILEMFERLLRDDAVSTESTGAMALARIRSGERFDVIFCDVIMDGCTGARLHQELAQTCPSQARRMVFMTGGAFTEESRRFLEGVGNPRLQKPPDVADLEKAIASILDLDSSEDEQGGGSRPPSEGPTRP